jgi:hypothetical protein
MKLATNRRRRTMSENANTTAKKKPDYAAYSLHTTSEGTSWTRIGVGFTYKNGGIGILYDAIPRDNRILLRELDRKPGGAANVGDGIPARKPDFEACNVRETQNDKSFWDRIGSGYAQEDGDITVLCEVIPLSGKIVLSVPKENK